MTMGVCSGDLLWVHTTSQLATPNTAADAATAMEVTAPPRLPAAWTSAAAPPSQPLPVPTPPGCISTSVDSRSTCPGVFSVTMACSAAQHRNGGHSDENCAGAAQVSSKRIKAAAGLVAAPRGPTELLVSLPADGSSSLLRIRAAVHAVLLDSGLAPLPALVSAPRTGSLSLNKALLHNIASAVVHSGRCILMLCSIYGMLMAVRYLDLARRRIQLSVSRALSSPLSRQAHG